MRNNPKPIEKADWINDDDPTKIIAPSVAQKLAGWVKDQLPPAQRFNWLWNLLSNSQIYHNAQVQDWVVIDSDADEGDYATLVAYIADNPAAGDRILVKEDQTVTAQVILPTNITLKFLDGASLLCATNIATSILQMGSNIVIEGILKIILSQTGTTDKAVEYNGDNVVGQIDVENSSTGTLTIAHNINSGKTGNQVKGISSNTGGGTLTNIGIDNSTEDSNVLEIVDDSNNQIWRSRGSYKFRDGLEFDLGSDADGDIYYRDAGVLKRLAKGSDEDFLSLKSGIPSWQKNPSFSVHRNDVGQTNITSLEKIEWTTENFDTNNDFDNITNYRFTPTVAGKYSLNAAIFWTAIVAGDELVLALSKNGTTIKQSTILAGGDRGGQNISAIVDANGTTDYFEIFARNIDRDTSTVSGLTEQTFFTGSRIS
ncbi:hypothetical protein KAR91_76310 [Candidatus Pacearchaeota archaeon]|nr:hypothetical protein [Candidatus Pacearchaeota archaeon]